MNKKVQLIIPIITVIPRLLQTALYRLRGQPEAQGKGGSRFWILVIRTRTFELKCPDPPIRFEVGFVHLTIAKVQLTADIVRSITAVVRAVGFENRLFSHTNLHF